MKRFVCDKASIGGLIVNETTNETIGARFARLNLEAAGWKDDDMQQISEEYQFHWQDYWAARLDEYKNNHDMDIAYFTDNAFGPEIDRVVSGDLPIFGAAFIVMLVYLALTLGKCNCVEARPLIAVGSLLSTICALIMGFGLGSAFGYQVNAIVLLIPFILLGVGVDDDIIIVESLNRTPLPNNDVGKEDIRFGTAMAHSGLSITLTSCSSIVAFAIGSYVDLPGVEAFCVFASLAFFSNYGMFDMLFHRVCNLSVFFVCCLYCFGFFFVFVI